MATLQHVFLRGHVFWWRRVHLAIYTKRIDVRLSLRTKDRLEARNRGAALTAAMPKVTDVLKENAEANPDITEVELREIAARMYSAILEELCTKQRSTPYDAEWHSIANLTYIDHFQRLTNLGGRMSFLASEEKAKEQEGWSAQRIADLKMVIARSEEGNSPLRQSDIIRNLEKDGFQATPRNQWRLELLLYPEYRDAFIEAQLDLQNLRDRLDGCASLQTDAPSTQSDVETPNDSSCASKVAQPKKAHNCDWSNLSPLEAADKMIAAMTQPLKHRDGGKRARKQTDEHTFRQIRWAAILLQKSLPTGTPLSSITQNDLKKLDSYFEEISTTYGKSPKDRKLEDTLELAVARAAEKVEDGSLEPECIGLSLRTSNRHFERLRQIYEFIPASSRSGGAIDFSCFISSIDEDESDARDRLSREQGKAIFQLPPWVGCQSEQKKERLQPGNAIFHDGLFFVLLLVWYTGARREELCKLMLDDVHHKNGTDFLLIRPTIAGRIKNQSARRVIVICDELIRLGFTRYVEEMRKESEILLFPELMPATSTKRKLGDVFYKLWWIYIKPHVPDLKRGQAMHSARHMVSDELKDQEVFLEYRNDHLGHKGKGGEGETRYPSKTSLQRLREIVNKIPVVTEHLPDQNKIQLLPKRLRTSRPQRKKD